MKKRNIPIVVLIVVSFVGILMACSRSQAQGPAVEQPVAQVEQPREETPAVAPQAETRHEETEAQPEKAEHMDDHGAEEHMAGHHDVPAEAAALANPVRLTDESVAAGATIYAQNCAVCHGETGEGDGPAAAALEKKPANLHADHVQELSDGALFWIITHGKPDTPMPPWDNILTETERWEVVNFLRTFGGAEIKEAHPEVE